MANPPNRTFQVNQTPIEVYDDKRDLGAAAASRALQIISEAIETRGRARLIIGTGNSQDEVVDSLVGASGIAWGSIEVFHMDEYAGIADTHPASFRGWLKRRVADVVHPGATHYLNGDAPDLDAECQRYADLLAAAPIDICFIGFGENGHIAFNDPHVADFNDPVPLKRVEMDERCRMQQVGEGHFKSIETMPREALTLTCPTLLGSANLICSVPDQRKAQAARDAIEGPLSTQCPASAVFAHPNAHVYLDTRSASLLS